MMKVLLFHFSILFCLLNNYIAGQGNLENKLVEDPQITTTLYRKAIKYLDHLAAHEFDEAASMFHRGFPPAALKKQLELTWLNQVQSYGKFSELRQFSLLQSEHSYHVFSQMIFEKYTTGLKLSFNKQFEIKRFEPIPSNDVPKDLGRRPPYDRPAQYLIRPIQIGSGKYPLKSRMYLPRMVKEPPVVIFTHDFGPQDLEHRTGVNGFFKDIAMGLASNGIACLLFPKRSYVHPNPTGHSITPSWEIIEDLYNAIFRIRTLPETKDSSVIWLSYGFSSYFVPHISKKKLFNGYVLLNPSFRHPAEILFEIEEFFDARNSKSFKDNDYIENLYKENQLLYDKKLDRNHLIFNYPASYFYSLERFKPKPLKSHEVSEPFMTLMAKRDFASNPADQQLIEEILKNCNYKSESFPALNRIFHVSDGTNPRQDFFTPGIVSGHVIGQIKKFITQLRNKIN